MSKHIFFLIKYFLSAFLVFWVAGYSGYFIAKKLVTQSEFRLAIAVDPQRITDNKEVYAFIGDSRMMDGVNALQANEDYNGEELIYNIGFNGLEMPDITDLVETFLLNCNCNMKQLTINAGAMVSREFATTEVQNFVGAFNPDVASRSLSESEVLKLSTQVFPLLHFNNEVFLRSLFYLLKGKGDQGHGNDYKFRVPDGIQQKLAQKVKVFEPDISSIDRLRKLLDSKGIELLVIVAPHHPVYTQNIGGYRNYIEEVKSYFPANVRFIDYSNLYQDKPEYFADLLHLNRKGQSEFTQQIINSALK